jgi:transcription initiation factor IIF auxiliary subunit
VEVQPFEVQEQGWGEFDIVVHVRAALRMGRNPGESS